jgi:micrococcal nuclease
MISSADYFGKGRWFAFLISLLLLPCAMCFAQEWGEVDYVPDGDTIILKDGRHVRYIGIDTPEIDHDKRRAEPMGYEARSLNRKLVEGQRVKLVRDRESHDRYGRTLAYVYREDGLFVNAELLTQGVGHVLYLFPNTAQHQRLLAAQKAAMSESKGLWKLLKKNEKPEHPFLGNRRSKRFHAHDCPNGNEMSPRNRVMLENRWEAFMKGYAPARECVKFPK